MQEESKMRGRKKYKKKKKDGVQVRRGKESHEEESEDTKGGKK